MADMIRIELTLDELRLLLNEIEAAGQVWSGTPEINAVLAKFDAALKQAERSPETSESLTKIAREAFAKQTGSG